MMCITKAFHRGLHDKLGLVNPKGLPYSNKFILNKLRFGNFKLVTTLASSSLLIHNHHLHDSNR